ECDDCTMSEAGRQARWERVRAAMDRLTLVAVVLRRPENFAWYTGGADNRVDHAAPAGVAAVVVTRHGDHVLTDNIEAPRMRAEQTPTFDVVEYQWHAGPAALVADLAGGSAIGADLPGPTEIDVAGVVAPLRYLLDDAIGRYRAVGADAVSAVDAACAALTPEMTETEAAGAVTAACRAAGLFTP